MTVEELVKRKIVTVGDELYLQDQAGKVATVSCLIALSLVLPTADVTIQTRFDTSINLEDIVSAEHQLTISKLNSEHEMEIQGIGESHKAVIDEKVRALKAEHQLKISTLKSTMATLSDNFAADRIAQEKDMEADHEAAITKIR